MDTTQLDETQKNAWASYQRLRLRLAERINRELSSRTGLSEADYEILTALTDAPDETVRALALRCGLEWEKSRLSHQLKRMETRGLVRREECIEDSRGTVIRMTDLGRQLAAEAQQHYEDAICRYVVDALTPEQLASLSTIADAILAKLEEGEGSRHHHKLLPDKHAR